MARPLHSHAFHKGEVPLDQLADGTATSGYAPISNGDGTATWGPAGGFVHLELDDSTYSEDGLRFTAGTTTYLGADGGNATDDATLTLIPGYVEITGKGSSVEVGVYADGDGDVAGVYGGAFQVDPPIVMMPNLPTSDPSVPGQLWLDGTTLRVSV